MRNETRIIVTAIPGGIENGKLKLSVSFSPQLHRRGADVHLGRDYYEIYNWPMYAEQIAENLTFNIVQFTADWQKSETTGVKGTVTPKARPDLGIWRKAFPHNTPVAHWQESALPFEIAQALTRQDIDSKVRAAIDECLRKIAERHAMDPEREPSTTASLILKLKRLKELSITDILVNPLITQSSDPLVQNILQDRLREIHTRYRLELDRLLLRLSLTEVYNRNISEMSEFHKRFSAYGQHPGFLRTTGWIYDYEIDRPTIDHLPSNRYFICVDNKNFAVKVDKEPVDHKYDINAFMNELEVLCPLTAYDYDFDKAVFGPKGKEDKNNTLFSRFTDYVNVDNTDFTVRSYLIDRKQLFLKIEDALQKGNATDVNTSAVSDIGGEMNAVGENTAGSNGYTTSGITLVIDKMAAIVKSAVDNNPREEIRKLVNDNTNLAAGYFAKFIENSAILYQHNVHQGYRVDAIAFNKNAPLEKQFQFGSLCEKTECFSINGDNSLAIGPSDKPNSNIIEGWMNESVQMGNDGNAVVDQELFKWNDWNLCTSLYNANIQEDEKVLHIITETPENSAVKLRYGWKYSFSLRPTDICGNSVRSVSQLAAANPDYKGQLEHLLKDEPKDDVLWERFTPPIVYQRVDGVHAPRLFHCKENKDWSTFTGSRGAASNGQFREPLAQLVVRSKIIDNEIIPEQKPDKRLIGPPRVPLNFVIQHGILDEEAELTIDEYERAVNYAISSDEERENFELEQMMLSLVQKDQITVSEADKGDTIDTANGHPVSEKAELNYLFDPIVSGYEIFLDEFPAPFPMPMAKKNKGARYADEVNYCLLQLEAGEPHTTKNIFVFGHNRATITITPGLSKNIRIQCTTMPVMGYTTEELFMPGITQIHDTMVTVVHAVQKPCLLGEKGNAQFKQHYPLTGCITTENKPGEDVFTISYYKFDTFPVLTSDTFILHVQYLDIVCDRTEPLGYKATYTEKVALSNIHPQNPLSENDVIFKNLRHHFHDTRHRVANYYIEASSKFRNYFQDVDHSKDNHPFSVFSNGLLLANHLKGEIENSNGIDSKKHVKIQFGTDTCYLKKETVDRYFRFDNTINEQANVLSTIKPPPPQVEKIVPILTWDVDKKGQTTNVTRRCSTIRIYLEGDWYETGFDEKLAVLFRIPGDDGQGDWGKEMLSSRHALRFKNHTEGVYKEQSFGSVISQLAADPISIADGISDFIDEDFFVNKEREVMGVVYKDLEFDKPISDKEVIDEAGLLKLEICAAILNVQFKSKEELNVEAGKDRDKGPFDKGKFYVDIEINPKYLKGHYFPFLRFAIARYQENSFEAHKSGRYSFSKVVMTDLVQPLPNRKVQFIDDGTKCKVIWNSESPRKENFVACFLENEPQASNSEDGVLLDWESDNRELYFILDNNECDMSWYKHNALYIAEYETHENDGMYDKDGNQYPPHGDPRIDARKRLVFSYRLEKNNNTP